jgi:glucose dehydrogenase
VPWNGRGSGDDLWTDSIVAIHIENGQLAWGFQTVHHDIWDWDVTNPPIIFDAVVKGKLRHGVAVASKTAWVYILDRYSGEPLLGIREKKVPQFTNPKEIAYSNLAKTQPYPVGDAFANQCASKKAWAGKKAPDGKPYRVGCIFTPYTVSQKGSFVVWQPASAVDWPPSAFSPQHNYAYLCATDGVGANTIGAIPKAQQRLVPGELYVGVTFGGAPKGVPPNYGRIVAMNVRTNRIAWTKKLTKPCYSGIMATAGDLVFAGISKPRMLEARSGSSGKVLWRSRLLDAGPNAPAITYTAHGKQYVAIVAGGNQLVSLTKPGDSVYAFALP